MAEHQFDVTRKSVVTVDVRDRNAFQKTHNKKRKARHTVVNQLEKIDSTLKQNTVQ